MACSHRFLNELIPDWEIEYLFVGTFNPEWDSPNGNNANYFYGRSTNDFWYILPQVFGGKNLMDKRFQKETLKDYLKNKKIGLTDIVERIDNVDFNIAQHKKDVFSFQDKEIEKYKIVFNDEIINLINRNTLRGIFFTRKVNNNSVLCQKWLEIRKYCEDKGVVRVAELVTPSRGYHSNGYTRDRKLQEWKIVILGN